MKRNFTGSILVLWLLAFCLFTFSSNAQTFGGGISVWGATNAPLSINGAPQTNFTGFLVPAKTLNVTGISNTNEILIASYGLLISNQGTNIYIPINSLTNSFASGTNGGTWSTNIPGQQVSFSYVIQAGLSIGPTNTNSVYMP